MRDIIEKIIVTENEAKTIVEKARSQAEDIVAEARRKGQDMVEHARRDAGTEAEKIIQTAVNAAEREKASSLALAHDRIEQGIRLDEESTRQAVEGVLQCVCGLNQTT
jgi:vacuolar-type H+-ATPase subunit H